MARPAPHPSDRPRPLPASRPFATARRRVALLACLGGALAAAAGVAPAGAADAPARTAASATNAAPLAEAEVRALMQQVAFAARARDVERLAGLLADDCRIELRTTMGGREEVTQFTKAEYVQMLTSGYASMRELQAYDYELVELQVEIEPRGATVRAIVHEAATFPGGTVATRSEEVSRVERRGDALQLVAVSATTQAQAAPPPPR
jgi:predicted lipid-binding transport protein (Tim44 family)